MKPGRPGHGVPHGQVTHRAAEQHVFEELARAPAGAAVDVARDPLLEASPAFARIAG